MYNNYKIIVVTPAGRAKHLDILKKYIYKEMNKGLIDDWQLWQNTSIAEDISYIDSMVLENPKVKKCIIDNLGEYNPFNIHKFFQFAQDDNTIYLRFDDDIVFIKEGAVEKLIQCRIDNPKPFIICANIINNTTIDKIHQDIGWLGKELGSVSGERLDELGWKNPEFVEKIHNTFMISSQPPYFPNRIIGTFKEFSISCFAFWGRDYFKPDPDEEVWISSIKPRELNRPNMICGNALVVHYAYFPQRPHLDTKPEFLEFYKNIQI